MNRDELLKRCVDRRVAHETSVVAVSHLFYVYLLSALKKGQRVEVPNFGTFGTHIVGVKRQRRLPFFEVENDLADKVNERYRNLKPLVVGRFELTPIDGDVEYEGKEPPYDPVVEGFGKGVLFDTSRDITADEFRQQEQTRFTPPAQTERSTEPSLPAVVPVPLEPEPPVAPQEEIILSEYAPASKEKKLMPKLNLRGEGMETPPPMGAGAETEPMQPPQPPPTLREIAPPSSPSPALQIILVLLAIALLTFALNYFGIVHLWGTKTGPAPSTESQLPPGEQPPSHVDGSTSTQPETVTQEPSPKPITTPEQTPVTGNKEQKGKPSETQRTPPKQTSPKPATGGFTIQVTSLNSRRDADKVLARLSKSGFDGYVSEAFVKGRKWFRVRSGRYATIDDARTAAAKMASANEVGIWVAKVDPGE
ncbi:MAG: SPOR domain-containing protein [bacterium]